MTMTFDPTSFRAWHAQLTEIWHPPGARGTLAVLVARCAYALVWLIAAIVVIGVLAALVTIAMRLAAG